MFAISFDLVVADTNKHHPKGAQQAYADIARELKKYDFERVQGSLYISSNEDMSNLVDALDALKALGWFAPSVRDIRAFRVEQWSNFTNRFKR